MVPAASEPSPLTRILDCRTTPSPRRQRVDHLRYAATPMSFGAPVVLRPTNAIGSLKRNSLPSRHIACVTTASLRATATQARFVTAFFGNLQPPGPAARTPATVPRARGDIGPKGNSAPVKRRSELVAMERAGLSRNTVSPGRQAGFQLEPVWSGARPLGGTGIGAGQAYP